MHVHTQKPRPKQHLSSDGCPAKKSSNRNCSEFAYRKDGDVEVSNSPSARCPDVLASAAAQYAVLLHVHAVARDWLDTRPGCGRDQ